MPEPPAMTHIDIEQHAEPESEEIPAHHYFAPVGGDHAALARTLGDEPSLGSVTLTRAEREHAEASGVSDVEYAEQKLKMMKAKKAGLIKD